MDNRKTREPTTKQAGIVAYISAYSVLKGFPPTEQEIADAFEVCRTAVTGHVRRLIKKGILTRSEKRVRNLLVAI